MLLHYPYSKCTYRTYPRRNERHKAKGTLRTIVLYRSRGKIGLKEWVRDWEFRMGVGKRRKLPSTMLLCSTQSVQVVVDHFSPHPSCPTLLSIRIGSLNLKTRKDWFKRKKIWFSLIFPLDPKENRFSNLIFSGWKKVKSKKFLCLGLTIELITANTVTCTYAWWSE